MAVVRVDLENLLETLRQQASKYEITSVVRQDMSMVFAVVYVGKVKLEQLARSLANVGDEKVEILGALSAFPKGRLLVE